MLRVLLLHQEAINFIFGWGGTIRTYNNTDSKSGRSPFPSPQEWGALRLPDLVNPEISGIHQEKQNSLGKNS